MSTSGKNVLRYRPTKSYSLFPAPRAYGSTLPTTSYGAREYSIRLIIPFSLPDVPLRTEEWHHGVTSTFPSRFPFTDRHRLKLIGVEGNVVWARCFRGSGGAIAHDHSDDVGNTTGVDARVEFYGLEWKRLSRTIGLAKKAPSLVFCVYLVLCSLAVFVAPRTLKMSTVFRPCRWRPGCPHQD